MATETKRNVVKRGARAGRPPRCGRLSPRRPHTMLYRAHRSIVGGGRLELEFDNGSGAASLPGPLSTNFVERGNGPAPAYGGGDRFRRDEPGAASLPTGWSRESDWTRRFRATSKNLARR